MQRNVEHIIAGLRLLQAHAEDGYLEPSVEGCDMSPEEIGKLISHFENIITNVEVGFRSRADMQGYRGNKRVDAQADFLAGAVGVLNEMPPSWYFACIRGELL